MRRKTEMMAVYGWVQEYVGTTHLEILRDIREYIRTQVLWPSKKEYMRDCPKHRGMRVLVNIIVQVEDTGKRCGKEDGLCA